MNNNDFSEEYVNDLANAGKGARPSQIRNAGILNQQNIQAEISSLTESFRNNRVEEEYNKLRREAIDLVRAETEYRKAGNKEQADFIKQIRESTDITTKGLKKLREQVDKVILNYNRIDNGLVNNYKELAKSSEEQEEFIDKLRLMQPTIDITNKNLDKLNQAFVDSRTSVINNTKAQQKQTQEANKEEHRFKVQIEETASQPKDKAVAKEWKELTSTLKGLVDTLNINALASQFAPTARQTLQQNLQANYNLTGRQFETFKKDLFNKVDNRVYTTNEIMEVMQTLSNSPLGNTQTATQYFNDLVRGQKLLGMSAQTQESLLKLGNITGRNELKFYTGQFAKYLNSSLGLNQQQLDELVNMNATLSAQAADIGIASDVFNEMTLNEAAAIESTARGYGNKYNQFVQRALSDDSFANLVFGMDTGELAQRLGNGESPLDLLRGSGGSASTVFGWMQNATPAELQRYKQYASSEIGIDENTWSLMMMITKHQDELQKNLLNATEESRKDAEEAMKSLEKQRLDATTGIQELVNVISNKFNANVSWTFEQGFGDINKFLTVIVGLLSAQSAFGNIKEILGGGGGKALSSGLSKIGITGAGGKALSGGGAALAGAGLVAGIAGLGFGLSDAFSNVANQSVKVSPTGNKLLDGGLSTWLSYERGMFMGNTYKGNGDNLGAGIGNTLKWGGIGAGIGTLIGGPVGTLIGGGIGLAVGAIGSAIGSSLDKNSEKLDETNDELAAIRRNTYETMKNTDYSGINAVYRYRGRSNYSSLGTATSRATGVGDLKYPVSSHYGPREPLRTTNGHITSSFHSGTDFDAPEGAPLYSNVTGTVVFSGVLDGANCIAVQDDKSGYIHWYAHMQKPSPLSKGRHVNQGEFVGYVGQTGNATGPHLHYAVTKPGSGLWLDADHTVDSLPFATDSIFSGGSSTSSALDGSSIDLSNAYRTKVTNVATSRLGDIANPIVGSITDLKNTIINLSEQTSRNQKIMDALVNRTMQSPRV